MVSLEPSENPLEADTASLNDDDEIDNYLSDNEPNPQIRSMLEPRSEPVKSIPVGAFLVVLLIVYAVFIFTVPLICEKHPTAPIDPYSILLFIQVLIWGIIFISDRCLHRIHLQSRQAGYMEFYRRTKNLRRVPFIITSLWNALLLITVTLVDDYCTHEERTIDEPEKCVFGLLSYTMFAEILLLVEVFTCLPFICLYIFLVAKFNRAKFLPDVVQDDLGSSFPPLENSLAEVGFRDTDSSADIIEKQADAIRYLKERNATLSRKLMTALRSAGDPRLSSA